MLEPVFHLLAIRFYDCRALYFTNKYYNIYAKYHVDQSGEKQLLSLKSTILL